MRPDAPQTMPCRFTRVTILLTLLYFGFVLPGCALSKSKSPTVIAGSDVALYHPLTANGVDTLLQRYAPHFEIKDFSFTYNRIGTPTARSLNGDDYEIFIDTDRPTMYTLVQKFRTPRGLYTNLIYRVHFPEVPWPNLGWGRNVGLLVYVTLNAREEPVLVTTLHTCGCYLAMIPTGKLPREQWPARWLQGDQNIYGEFLPGYLDLPEQEPYGRLVITVRGENHRVMAVAFRPAAENNGQLDQPTRLEPMTALDALPLGDRRVSLFEQEGGRRGYVKNNRKPLEMLFMGWWALDSKVGRDKALGPPEETGVAIYTSLKFWDRESSNIWYFPDFLKHWGWDF